MAQKKKIIPKQSFEDWSRQQHGVPDDEQSVARRKAWEKVYNAYYAEDDADIAPVAQQKEEERTWFESGLFDDGWQFGDLTKTILGTTADLASNVGGGLLEMGENVVDAGAYIVGGVGKLFGADEFAEDTRKFIADDLYSGEEIATRILTLGTKGAGAFDDASVLGEKLDSLAQSGGQLAGTIALQAVGVPWFVTTGVTSFGRATEQAFSEGAGYVEAGVSAAISAGAEIITEKLFGGSGLGEKGLINLDYLTKGISNKIVKSLADLGIDMAAEGTEEVLSSIGSRIGSSIYKEENALELLTSEEAFDEYLESFIGGAALSGVMNAGKVNNARQKKGGLDYRTGLTSNEEAVFNKAYEDAIAEEEKKNGKELTKKQKAELYDSVTESLKRGEISTDTIEAVLGGESYKAYKDTVDSETELQKEIDKLQKEYNGLNELEIGEERKAEIEKLLPELKQKLTDIQANSNKGSLKENLAKEVYELAKQDGSKLKRGSYLVESYKDYQKFEVDLSKYDGLQKESLEDIMKKGHVNNKIKSHEFWEFATKQAAERGEKVTSTTTAEIREMETKRRGERWVREHFEELVAQYGEEFVNEHREELVQKHGEEWVKKHLPEGVTPNAYYMDDGTIALNVESRRVREYTFGHEIGHDIKKGDDAKKTGYYADLQKQLFEYAEKKEGAEAFKKRRETIERLYADGVGDVNVELTNDLIGEYLYNDPDFIKNLSVKDKNLFQRLWDSVKHLYKMATAGSQEARDLERIKKLFEEAYRETANVKTEAKGNVDFSLSDAKIPTKEDISKKNPMRVVDISTPQTEGAFADRRRKIRENAKDVISKPYLNSDTNSLIFLTKESYNHTFNNLGEIQLNAAEHLPELIENAVLTHAEKPTHGSHFSAGVYTFFAAAKTDKGIRPVKLKVKEYVYSGQDLPSNIKEYFENSPQGYAASYDTVVLAVEEIEESPAGSGKDMAQKEPFLTPDGLLTYKVADLIELVKGDSEKYLPQYSLSVENKQKQLDIINATNPMWDDYHTGIRTIDDIRTWEEVLELNDESEGQFVWGDFSRADAEQALKDGTITVYSSYPIKNGVFVSTSYIQAQEYAGGKNGKVYSKTIPLTNVAWINGDEGQYAEVTTADDIAPAKYSLSDSDGNQLTEEQQDYFKDSVVRDENGNLIPLYHGTQNGGFTVFGKTNDYGYFFTDDIKTANSYSGSFEVLDTKKIKTWDDAKEYAKKSGFLLYYSQSKDAYMLDDYSGNITYWKESDLEELARTLEKRGKKPSKATNYKTYLNLTNPLIVNGNGSNWDNVVNHDENGNPIGEGMRTKQWVKKALDEGYDGVIFKDIYDTGKFGGERKGNVYVALKPEQIKSVNNTNPTSDPDIRYSLSQDSEGREISDAVQKRFANTKVVDESGRLKTVYHGTASGEFFIFDKAKGSVEGDFGSGFYFTDNETDVEDHYEGGGPDFENKVIRRAEQLVNEDDLDWDEAERKAREELFKGSYKHEVYLNIEKPAIVGETNLLESQSYFDEYNQEDYDNEEDYYADVEQLVADDIDNIIWEIERNVDVDRTDGIAEVLWEAFNDGGIGIEQLKKKLNNLYLEDSEGNYVANEVARQIIESLGYDGIIDPTVSGKWNMEMEEGTTHYIVFKPNQIKSVTNQNPTDNPDIRYSLSYGDEPLTKDSMVETALKKWPTAEDIAPTQEDIAPLPTYNEPAADPTVFDLEQEKKALQGKITEAMQAEDWDTYNQLAEEYQALEQRINQMQADEEAFNSERLATLDDMDAPIEQETEYYSLPDTTPLTKKAVVDISRSVRDALGLSKRQMAEVRAIIEEYSASEFPSREELYEKIKERFGVQTAQESQGVEDVQAFLRDSKIKVSDTIKGDIADYNNLRKRLFRKIGFGNDGIDVDSAYQELTDLYPEFFPEDIVNPTDQFLRMAEVAKMDKAVEIEYELDSETIMEAADIIVNEVSTFRENHRRMAAEREARHLPKVAPVEDGDIAPVPEAYEAIRPKQQKEPRMARATPEEQASAEILTEEPQTEKKKSRFWSQLMEKVGDKGFVFENLSKKTKNRKLEAKWNFIRYADGNAQTFMQEGAEGVSSLKSIVDRVEKSGKTKEFYEYMYHLHNIDRMTLAERKLGKNKTVFGDTITAESSSGIVAQLESANPEFKEIANEIYTYNKYLRKMLVAGNVISQETADLWEKMYPHYVPIRRLGDSGLNINVPLDTGKTGVNAPIKKATGGNRDILPLFDTMAQRTLQTYKAVAKNRFGIELKNTLGTTIESEVATLDGVIDSIDAQESLLQEGKNGRKPTFTVFENGEKVTFEITEDMYDAMKPKSEMMAYTNKFLNTLSNLQRNVLTQYNPVFMLTNAAKDIQDVLINSQHAAKTYANFPKAIAEMATKGKYYTEYMRNGGEQNTYFENESNTFKEERKGIKKLVGMPLDIISTANNIIERLPRLAEYIASRESGRSIEVSMLDAARVTTNFAAGGDLTKALNRNGFTFLNASVQGAMQQVRNIREAKMNGLKGWVGLATKFAIAGLAAEALNHLLWDDDDEYEELSDYVKQNYYVVAKTEDGTFIRIPKGRAVAVIQDAFEQISNAATGDDEVDLKSFLDLAVSNLAPNDPLNNNILAPITQMLSNKTWYGEDLVPTRLQDLPAAEQYDESTDELSKWLGETLNYSPYKINYLLDQYSGGLGDVFLPMMTPEAERGDDNNLIAPLIDKFTTDSTMNNQNISDFYDMKEQLTMNANSRNATDEDVLKSKFFNAVNAELSDLYARKREVQNSSLSDAQKYSSVRAIQEQINAIARDSLNEYNNVNIENGYATVGDIHYRLTENEETGETEWKKITDKQLEKQEEVTRGLGISASEYWSNKAEYDYAYESPAKYAVAKAVGGYKAFKDYSSALYDIKADKDSSGKSISGSRKEKVIEWINGLDADYGEKIILFKSEYTADDTYNYEIVDYLNSRDDISYEEMEAILKELGFTVKADGTITW